MLSVLTVRKCPGILRTTLLPDISEVRSPRHRFWSINPAQGLLPEPVSLGSDLRRAPDRECGTELFADGDLSEPGRDRDQQKGTWLMRFTAWLIGISARVYFGQAGVGPNGKAGRTSASTPKRSRARGAAIPVSSFANEGVDAVIARS
jgi:hypothetical protein